MGTPDCFDGLEPPRQAEVAGAYLKLEKACQELMLQPDEFGKRVGICRLLKSDNCSAFRPGTLARGLAEEARAHADDLALRLDHAGSDALTIRAAAARLHQTLACLRVELGLAGRLAGDRSGSLPFGTKDG